jgi:tetratricopeptide (TPR) repeat protein
MPAVDGEVSRKVFDEFKKFVETGDFERGAKLLEEWLKKSPMDLVNRQNLVHILLKLEEYERALPHLRFMADEAENKGEWLGHLGRALVKVGEYARAAEALAEGLALLPENVDLLLDLAKVHATRKDWSASKAVLEKGLLLEQRVPEILAELAAVLVELGEYKDASARFKQLQRLQPTYETALTMAKIASQYERCPDVVDALVDWEKEFADETPHLLLGACAIKAKESVKAQKHFLLGLKANDKCFYCALWLGDLYLASQDWDNAVKYYALAAPITPRDHRPFHQLGKALANQGKHIQAARALQKADERKANDPEILYPLGMELVRAGEKATAWDVWARLEPLDRARADEIKALLIGNP